MVRVIRKLFKILDRQQRKKSVLLLFLMVLGALMESLSVSLVLPLITAVMDPDGWDASWYSRILCDLFAIDSQHAYIQVLLLLLIGIFIVKDIYIIWEYYVQFTFIARGRLQMQQKLMDSYTGKPYAFYLNVSSGEVIRVITSDTEQTSRLLTSVLTFLTEVIVSAVLGVTVFIISPALAAGLLLMLSLEIMLIAKAVKPVMKRLGMRRRTAGAATNKWILQAIQGIKSIKVSQTEDFFNRMYRENAGVMVDADRKQQTLSNVPRLLIESVTVTAVLGIVFFQVLIGTDLADIVPQLSAFVAAAVRLLPSMNRISTSMNQIPFWEGGLDNIIKITAPDRGEGGEDGVTPEVPDGGEHTPGNVAFKTKLCMSGVTFAYPGCDRNVLESADMEIRFGQSVGIVGPSGAGKTTAVDILLGLLKPQEGKVLADGRNIEEDLQGWLKAAAYIPQKIFLMDSTIRENVAFGAEPREIDDDKVWETLREAQMEDFVRSLPAGLETTVGEQGIRLSGGQCQRIGIARALYRDPDILFFDEATSSLDNETEAAIMESVEKLKGRRTLVIVAHRLTTIANCDVVYRVEEGKIRKER